ncbi:MAG: DUF2334 domain-containing protein [Pseudobdellovibrio sp.]
MQRQIDFVPKLPGSIKMRFLLAPYFIPLISLVAVVVFAAAWSGSDFKFLRFSKPEQEVTSTPIALADSKNCVQIFYDTTTDVQYKNLGRTYGLMLANLLGHFPEYQQIIGPIDLYVKGDLEKCHASFYIGTTYDKPLPSDFIEDYKTTTKQIIWMGYNFWQLGSTFEDTFGYSTRKGDYIFTGLDTHTLSPDGKPGYFRDILYKGKTFYKYGKWSDANKTSFVAAYEMTRFAKLVSRRSKILAKAKHSTTGEVIPWALQADNKFYVTEVPFSYVHEADRYFVFADLLFDFLKSFPKHTQKNAFIRLEDIHDQVDLDYLGQAVDILQKHNVTPHIMVIPIYKDPTTRPSTILRMEDPKVAKFAETIRKYKSEGSVFIWHGVTHQYNEVKNPFSGISGDDYEFWDISHNRPIAEDSTTYVLNRLQDGFSSLKHFSIIPKLWVTPHYHASALDDIIFGKVFNWVIGRGLYNDFKMRGMKDFDPAEPIRFSSGSPTLEQNQKNFFADLLVTDVPGFAQFNQLFPYEIYGNIYGQKVIPENLGNVQPELTDQVVATRNVDTILADARRNLVLRDVWASVFYHPFLLNPALNSDNANNPIHSDLSRLVYGLKKMGYTFINLENYIDNNHIKRAKPKIELVDVRPGSNP